MNGDKTEFCRLAQKRTERTISVAALRELRALALHGVLEARREERRVALALQGVDRLKEQLVAGVGVL